MRILTITILSVIWAVSARAETYVWNGAGVSGGTSNSAWETAGNWLVSGTPPATAPGVNDDANITLNVDHTTNIAVVVSTGATARHVTIRGMADTRFMKFQGDATFSTLDYVTTKNTLIIVESATLTLTGGQITAGTVTKATFKAPGEFSVYASLSFAGKIRCTGTQVGLSIAAVDGDIYVDNPNAEIHFMNTTMRFGGNLYVHGTQSVGGFNASGIIVNRHSKDLYIAGGGALTNWGACNIGGLSYTMSSGSPFTFPAGTYNSVSVQATFHYSGNVTYGITGDVVFDGTNSAGYAVYVHRRRYSDPTYYAAGADFNLNSNNLTVSGGGPIQIGDFTDAHSDWWNRLQAEDSTVTTDGDVNIGPGGYITGDANTVISLASNWNNRCTWQTNNFALALSTVKMTGSGNGYDPQLLEVHGKDLGATLTGQVNANLAFGRLEIGNPGQETYVRLVDRTDLWSDGKADALYVGSLEVHAGSTLNLHGLNLYVNGVSVRGHWTEYGAGLIYDSTKIGTIILFR